MTTPPFPRLPSVWDGPLGPPKEGPGPEAAQRRGGFPRRPAPAPAAAAVVAPETAAPEPAAAEPSVAERAPVEAAETEQRTTSPAGLADAEAVAALPIEPETGVRAIASDDPVTVPPAAAAATPGPQLDSPSQALLSALEAELLGGVPSGMGDGVPATPDTAASSPPPELPPEPLPAAEPVVPVAASDDRGRASALEAALRELDAEDESSQMLAGLPPQPPLEQESPRRPVGEFQAEPEDDLPDPDLPEPSPEASMLAIAAILEEESNELALLGPSAPKPVLRPSPKPVSIAVAPDIAQWFAARGIDLEGKTDALLRRYVREIDKQRKARRR